MRTLTEHEKKTVRLAGIFIGLYLVRHGMTTIPPNAAVETEIE